MTMSILGKKNFFKRFSGSRLTREAPRIETANNKTPSIVINNEVSEKTIIEDLSILLRLDIDCI